MRPVASCSVPKLALPITRLSISRPATATCDALRLELLVGQRAVLAQQVGGVVRGLEVVREGDALAADRGELLAAFGDQLVVVGGGGRRAGCGCGHGGVLVEFGPAILVAGAAMRSIAPGRLKSPGCCAARVIAACSDDRALHRAARSCATARSASRWSAAAASRRTTSRRCAQHAERAELVGRLRHRARGAGRGRAATGAPGFASLDDAARRQRRRRRRAGHAERPASAPGDRGRARRPPRDDRKADGDALGRRPAHGARLRRRRRASCSSSSRTAATRRCSCSSARSTQGRFGRIYMVNVNVFWTRPQSYYDSAAWRGTLGIRRRRLHEPGEPLRRPARLAGRPGRERACLHRARWRATSRSRTPA